MADKQTRKYLKSVGVDIVALKKSKSIDDRIAEGKEKHRKFLQEQKNLEIKKTQEKNPYLKSIPSVFLYRNTQDESNYSNFAELLKNKNWEDE